MAKLSSIWKPKGWQDKKAKSALSVFREVKKLIYLEEEEDEEFEDEDLEEEEE